MREVAAASGGSAPTSSATSGKAERGGSEQGLNSLTAILATELDSLKGSVNSQFVFRARQGDPEK